MSWPTQILHGAVGDVLIGVKISLRPWKKPIGVWVMSLCHLCPRCQRDVDCNTDKLRANVPLSSIIHLHPSWKCSSPQLGVSHFTRLNQKLCPDTVRDRKFCERESWKPFTEEWVWEHIYNNANLMWAFLEKPFSMWLVACTFVKKEWKGVLIPVLREQQLTSRDSCDWILALNSECTKFSYRCQLMWIRRYA